MRRIWFGLVAGLFVACPGVHKVKPTRRATVTPTTAPTKEPEEEIGLISVRAAPLSEQSMCVYGGWTCLSGEQAPLLRCTTDGGQSFSEVSVAEESCAFVKDYQVSGDGSSVWFSCEGKDKAPYFVRSLNRAQSFDLSEPVSQEGELLAWAFSSSKSGIAVVAAEGALAEKNIAYVEKGTTDAGKTWQLMLEISNEFAARFNPELEIGSRPPQPEVSSFVLQSIAGPDGGPAYRLEDKGGKPLLSLAWRDIPIKCSPAGAIPLEDLLPGTGPGQWVPK